MKANEFFKKVGIEAVKSYIVAYEDHLTDELKRLIESHELVEKHGGLFSAKCQIENECPDLEFGELEYYVDGEIFFTRVKDLDQAIADVESCQ